MNVLIGPPKNQWNPYRARISMV